MCEGVNEVADLVSGAVKVSVEEVWQVGQGAQLLACFLDVVAGLLDFAVCVTCIRCGFKQLLFGEDVELVALVYEFQGGFLDFGDVGLGAKRTLGAGDEELCGVYGRFRCIL